MEWTAESKRRIIGRKTACERRRQRKVKRPAERSMMERNMVVDACIC